MEKGRLIWKWLEEEPGPVLSVVTWLLGWTALLWLALEEWR